MCGVSVVVGEEVGVVGGVTIVMGAKVVFIHVPMCMPSLGILSMAWVHTLDLVAPLMFNV